jgi:hemoglobin-like flavoprotein
MTPAEIRIVKRSFALIEGEGDRAAAAFFAHLFEIDPTMRLLFPGDLRRRGIRLIHAVGLIVEDLHRLHVFVPALEALAVRYVGYGLEQSHYAVVGEALTRTARSILGIGFTPELEAALNSVYSQLSAVMMDAARWDYRLAA